MRRFSWTIPKNGFWRGDLGDAKRFGVPAWERKQNTEARLWHMAGTQVGQQDYMNMKHLEAAEHDASLVR